MQIGWKFITWTGRPGHCNVEPCSKKVNAGHVRVDHADPYRADFVVICEDCWFKVMCGIDPDPNATIPQWEEDRRAKASPDS